MAGKIEKKKIAGLTYEMIKKILYARSLYVLWWWGVIFLFFFLIQILTNYYCCYYYVNTKQPSGEFRSALLLFNVFSRATIGRR